jgi:folate-binding protein YgfZ
VSHESERAAQASALAPAADGGSFQSRVTWTFLTPGVVAATGPDAVRFVDNFATAAVSQLADGAGTESFFADARGWVVALTTILRTDAGLLLLTDPSLATPLRDHLEHYHIREAVELSVGPAGERWILVAGAGASERLVAVGAAALPAEPLSHLVTSLGNERVRIVRTVGQGADGFLIEPLADCDIDRVAGGFAAAGLPEGDPADLEPFRIEAGFPTPADIPPKTLPQELDRNDRAISFTKGCYLGQETVARLDALGHVNRRLVRLVIEAAGPPPVPAAILSAGAEVGTLTSAARSPRLGRAIGLGLMSVKALAAGDLVVDGSAARLLSTEARS